MTDGAWRGIGVIPRSGWRLNADYRDFDAELRFHITGIHTQESPLCCSGDVLRGAIKPADARPSERNARRAIRSAPLWFPAKAPAPLTITMAASSPPKNWPAPEKVASSVSPAPFESWMLSS